MRVHMLSRGFELTEAIEAHVHSRVNLTLGTADGEISGVTVRLADLNAGRGGTDKLCRVVVWMRHLGAIVVEARDADCYVAIDDAVRRAREAVWRHIKRRRTLRREYANRPLKRQIA